MPVVVVVVVVVVVNRAVVAVDFVGFSVDENDW